MKPKTPHVLMAFVVSSNLWAASPYESPYGIQWNFMIGTSGADMGGGSRVAVTSDGTVFVHNRTGVSTWGVGDGGNVRGGLGAITPLGGLLYGTTVSSLPTLVSPGQQYAAGVSAVGNKAHFTVYGGQGQHWTDEDGKDGSRAMIWSLDSSGLDSIADQRSLSKFTNAAGNPPRTDLLQPTTTGLTPAAGQNRISGSALRASTMDMVMVMDMVAGDFATAGDYEGYNLRNNNTADAYLPGIGVYNLTANTLSGPAKQPILTHTAATGSNMGVYFAAGIDQATGRYYGAGISHSRNESTSDSWDPDASGPAPAIPIVNSTSNANTAGIGTAYDASHNLLYAVTWDSPGYDTITTIAPTDDGSDGAFWAGEKQDICHIELRDAAGDVVWSDSFDMSPAAGDPPGNPGVQRIASVIVAANGDLMVSGYFENGGPGGGVTKFDNFVRKYEKVAADDYVLQWESTVGIDDARDLAYASALDPAGISLYLLSDTWGQWPNTTGHVYAGNSDLLLQKLSPGDFNSDGLVDFDDVQLAGTATKPGLPGDDTYDFNGDGDSTLDDTLFMITTVMGRLVGDIAQDPAVTDVDNADIGRVIGALGVGTLYLEGDVDFDGSVDATDLSAVAGAFTGAQTPGTYASGAAGATLRYRPDDGRVWIHADEAAGEIITSFQIENTAGTFEIASYTGPVEGSFDGTLKDVGDHVIADSDLTFTGVGGVISLGNILPAGMDQAVLEAYLTTAVYTGGPGTGQMDFTLMVGDLPTPYGAWTQGPFAGTLDIPFANIDFDGDGLETGIEYVLGGDPTLNDHASIAPTQTFDGSNLLFTFRRADIANEDPDATIEVRYSTDLQTWSVAEDGVDSVTIVETDNFYGSEPGIDRVEVTLPAGLAVDGKLFARLEVSGLPELLFSEDFESGDGGFTVATAGGSDWEYGAPNTPNPGGGAVTSGNSGANCWGTNLNGAYGAGTDTKLRSPVIDLTGVAGATLSFAEAIDIQSPHTLVVNVIEADTDAIVDGGAAVHTSTPDSDINNTPWETVGSVAIPGGQKVRIEWHFVGDGDGTNYLGAYIDDVTITTP